MTAPSDRLQEAHLDLSEPILHHYDSSPFSEKVRTAFGIKGIAWRSVVIPNMMPKPDYVPLTGGYRRTPSMQIGAEVWCDSAAILRELERRYPDPTLYTGDVDGVTDALRFWSDRSFFMVVVQLVFGTIGHSVSQAFIDDRARMSGTTFDLARMRAAVPVMREQCRAHLGFLDRQLADGRRFLGGQRPGLLDLHPWHVVWFLRTVCPEEAGLIDAYPAIVAWETRMRAIGHGHRREVSARDALALAAVETPETLPSVDPLEPNGLRAGMKVEVAPDDYGRDLVAGELLVADPEEIALLRRDSELGEVVVHFPRAGYVILPRE